MTSGSRRVPCMYHVVNWSLWEARAAKECDSNIRKGGRHIYSETLPVQLLQLGIHTQKDAHDIVADERLGQIRARLGQYSAPRPAGR